MEQRESRLLKQQEVGGGFSPEDYTVERLWATAPDGGACTDDATLPQGTAV